MVKTRMFILAVLLLAGADDKAKGEEKRIGATLEMTYVSKYVSKGRESYGQQSGIFSTIDLDFWGTGLGAWVRRRDPVSSGYVNRARYEYAFYYGSSAFEESIYAVKYKAGWTYKNYFDNARNVRNTQEFWYKFSWQNLLPWSLVPAYAAYYETPAGSGYGNRAAAGWHHSFGLKRRLEIADLPPITASAFVDYKDGLGGGSIDHDWSHATFGLSTGVRISEDLSFVPGIYHQVTMDKSVSRRKDITYCTLSMKYEF
jgi:hypothetical protein